MADSIVVLHVDDEPEFADLAAQFLEREDDRIEVVTETNAENGLDHLEGGDVDCIVSDYEMPGLDGLGFLERVREREPDLPFILFTGKGSEEVASEALSKGATDYLQKQSGTDQYTILANRVRNYVETARSESQRRRQLDAIETAHEGISILDKDGEFVFVNEAYAELFGYEPETMLEMEWEQLYPPGEMEAVEREMLPALEKEGTWRGEGTGRRADGSTVPVDHTLSLTERGELICTVRDVSEQRERERALERHQTVVEAMGDGIYALDADGAVIHANDVVLDMLGVEYDELIGEDLTEFYSQEDMERFESAIRSLLKGETDPPATIRATVDQQGGGEIPIEVSLTLLPMNDGEFRGTVGVIRDIGDRVAWESELEMYRNAFESALSPIAIADADERLVAVNQAFLELWGYDDESAVLGRHVSEFWAEPESAAAVAAEVAATGEWAGELEAEFADGTTSPIECAASVITDEDGEVSGLVSAFLDLSERTEELDRYETLLEVMPDTVVVTDLDGVIQDIHGFEGWGGYDYDELIGEHMSKTSPPEVTERAESIVADMILQEDYRGQTFEYQIETKDGELIPFENHITVLPPNEDGEITHTMSILRNISERKQRERELERQNERLEEFAGIVSHDLRNPLNVAAGRLDLARDEHDSEHLKAVDAALQRMETLIDDLLTLALERESVEDFEEIDLARLVEESWDAVHTEAASLEVTADRRIHADESRMKQLLENLMRNAVEHAGEDVTVRVGPIDTEGGFFVADDGPGIPEGEREAIFENGYSTDPEGTGFGLSIVQDVAAAHGWDVRVTDSETGGARFEIVWTDDVA